MPDLLEDFSLTRHNSLGLPSKARYAVEIDAESALPDLLEQQEEDPRLYGLPRLILGGGSNVVLPAFYPGLVMRVTIPGRTLAGETGAAWLVDVGAGENWHGFVEWTLAQDRPGLENLALIPGLAGGAPIQNIGAYGLEMARFCESVRAWDFGEGGFVELGAAECGFGYRDSVFKQEPGRYLVTRVRFALPKDWTPNTGYAELAAELAQAGADKPTPRAIFDAVVAIRRRKLPDPTVLGNAGSFFKNPVVPAAQREALLARFPALVSHAQADGGFKLAAGWLVEQCGFKGTRRGAVGVHDRQTLVLVHEGGGAAQELLALAAEIRAAVREKFGVALEMEPVVV
ncbi:MAG: UDP-N-acetylmuramate dehydrogenase [Candidatus Protistobacter heckmanni]|nr:UDP-N-acetylmuramate dehydrogenase [Candidatus Protistobacter heckmanni]